MLSEEGNGKRSKRGAVSNVKPPREFRRQDDSDSIPFRISTPCQARGANHAPFRQRGTSDSERCLSVQPLNGHPGPHPGGTRCLQTPCTRLGNRVKPLPKRLAPVKVTPVVRIKVGVWAGWFGSVRRCPAGKGGTPDRRRSGSGFHIVADKARYCHLQTVALTTVPRDSPPPSSDNMSSEEGDKTRWEREWPAMGGQTGQVTPLGASHLERGTIDP